MDPKIAIVTWSDSRVVFAELSDGDVPDLQPALMTSAGHLVREDEQVVVLAQDMVEHPGEPRSWRNVLIIPRRDVIAVERMRPIAGDFPVTLECNHCHVAIPTDENWPDGKCHNCGASFSVNGVAPGGGWEVKWTWTEEGTK